LFFLFLHSSSPLRDLLSFPTRRSSDLSKTDIRFLPYFSARLAHGLLAIVFCYIFYTIYDQHTNYFSRIVPTSVIEQSYTYTIGLFFQSYGFYITFGMIFIAFLLQLRKIIR